MKKLFTREEFIESYPYSFDKEVKLKLNKWCNELLKQNFIDKLLRKNNNIINYTDILNLNDMSSETVDKTVLFDDKNSLKNFIIKDKSCSFCLCDLFKILDI